MTEAAAAVVAFGFESMGLHRAEAQIHPGNQGSRRVLEKLGFVQEGYIRENYYEPATDEFSDSVIFSLLRADWARRRAAELAARTRWRLTDAACSRILR